MRFWLFYIAPYRVWKFRIRNRRYDPLIGVFKNLNWVIPGRWGFYFIGFEFGNRNPGGKFGKFIKKIGIYPW